MGSSQKLSMAFLLRLGDLLGVRPVGIYEMKPTLTDVEYRLISIRKMGYVKYISKISNFLFHFRKGSKWYHSQGCRRTMSSSRPAYHWADSRMASCRPARDDAVT
jgi:hypothetical protein